jgi:dihydropteroate synthase
MGGESTRPGVQPLDEELERVIPIIEVLRAESAHSGGYQQTCRDERR